MIKIIQIKIWLIILLASICFHNTTFSQSTEKDDEMPSYMDMRTPNLKKIQRRADRYFRKKLVQAKEEDVQDSSKSFEQENIMGGRDEDNEYHRYKRWEWFWRDRVNPDGSFPDPLKSFEVYKQLQGKNSNQRLEVSPPAWKSIGATKNSGGYWGMGQARSVAVFPGNPNIYYVTSVGGGVWKTTDAGATYTPIGDGLPQLFCGTVLVDNLDPNTVYVNIGGTGEWWLTGLGVYKTTNGGLTWTATGLTGTRTNGINIKKMAMSPTDAQVIFAATNKGLYKTTNGGTSWTVVRPGEHGDVVFRPSDGSTVYTASDDYYGGSEIYRSIDGGNNWTQKTTVGKTKTRIYLAVTASDKEFIGGLFKTDGSTKDLYISSDRGNSFTFKSNTATDADIFYISQLNKNIMYCAGVTMKQSKDGGSTWTEITNWCCPSATKPEIHADFHGATHNPLKLEELYFCNDGGTYKYNENTNIWTDLCNGLVIAYYYRIASAQTNNVILSGAMQDNGGNARKADGTWRNTSGGDATLAMIDPSDENIQYSSYINGNGIVKTTQGWNNSIDITTALRNAGAVGGDWVTPFALDPSNPANIVAGYQDVMYSNNRGDNWIKISNNLTNGGNLQSIAIAASDGNVIYTSKDNILYRTYDKGANWSNVASPAGNISRIAIHPSVSKTIYITCNGGNGKRVYKSVDGGNTWTNLTLNFPNDVTASCIVYEKGTNEGLYLGTPIGVFYKNATFTQWIYYGTGLPNSEVSDISIAYGAKKIRVGTIGRSIWECDLYTDPNALRDPENPINVVNGLNFDFFKKGYDVLPDFDKEAPEWKGGVISNFNTSFLHPADSFAVKFYGYIDIPTDGDYTFYSSSDDGSKLYIGSRLILNNDGQHGMTEQSGTISLKKGKHAISVEYFQKLFSAGLEIRFSGPGIAKQFIPDNMLYMPSLRNPDVLNNFILNGLDYKYYDGYYTVLPDFATLTPASTGSISQFNLNIPNRNDNSFAVRYVGYVEVQNDGIYTFYTATDDGSKLYIGNQLIVNNDGGHGPIEASGQIGLKKGRHSVTLEYFQGVGGLGMDVLFSGPFLYKGIIPATALFRTIPLRNPENPANTLSGLKYQLYNYTGSQVPNFTILGTPLKSGTVNQIDLSMAGKPASHYAIKYSGFVNIPTDGEYTFFTNSDDGSKLYIGNTLLINNDGLHSAAEKSGTIGLKKGKHMMSVEYLEYDLPETLNVSYQSNNINKTIIPATAFFFDATLTAFSNEIEKNKLASIYPNPFSEKLSVDVFSNNVVSVKFLTLNGKAIEGINYLSEGNSYSVTVPHELASGVYIIQIVTDESTYSYKVLKK